MVQTWRTRKAEREAEQQAVAEIREKLATDHEAAAKALAVLYSYQTPEEQQGIHTDEVNGVGFSKYDSDILSSFAQQLQAGYQLSQRQLEIAFDKLPKYASQLYRLGEIV